MEAYTSSISLFAFPFAVEDWAICQGQQITTSSNQALYALIGTTFGGTSTAFKLPDFEGRAGLSYGSLFPGSPGFASIPIGQAGGQQTTQMTISTLPAHSHYGSALDAGVTVDVAPPVSMGDPDSKDPEGNYLPQFDTINAFASTAQDVSQMAPDNRMVVAQFSTTVQTTGGGKAFSCMSPYQVLNYQMCLQGFFPSRN